MLFLESPYYCRNMNLTIDIYTIGHYFCTILDFYTEKKCIQIDHYFRTMTGKVYNFARALWL